MAHKEMQWHRTASRPAKRQVPGRVGDAAVAGGAAYADNEAGGCGSTGNGDAHLRFLPCFQVERALRLELCL